MPKVMSRESTDDFLIPVTVLVSAAANADPTGDVVRFAFLSANLPNARPADADWQTGFWLTRAGGYLAGITVGPGAHATYNPGPGKWNAWIQVEDNPTIPTAMVDTLTIT